MYTVCKNIKRLRLMHKMTQKELAKALNISPKTVSKWETMAGLPDTAHIIPLAKLFGVSTDELLLPAPEPEPFIIFDEPHNFPLIWKYGISTDTLCSASGASREIVEKALSAGEKIAEKALTGGFAHTPEEEKQAANLSQILSQFTITMSHEMQNPRHNIYVLALRLESIPGFSLDTVDKYAGLEPGTLEGFLDRKASISTEQQCQLITALFLLESTLCPDMPYPWLM